MFVPGRIEFLGKHTDYCGGESIVCPIDRGFHFDFEAVDDQIVTLENRDSGETLAFNLTDTQKHSGWVNYAVEVGSRLRANFGESLSRGASISFTSDLPQAAGLSSSSALMIMVFKALSEVNRLDQTEIYQANIHDELDLAEYLGCVENGRSFLGLAGSAGVGTFGGSQDHAAIIAGRAGLLTRFAFDPLQRVSDFKLPDDYCFVIATSGVVAEKTGLVLEKYNRVSRMAAEITSRFSGGTLASIIGEHGLDEVERVIRTGTSEFSPDDLINRVRQFYEESFEIIPKVAELIEFGQLSEIGALVDRSQRNAESMLGNQVEETVHLQRAARALGAIAASAFGAGFGGSVYALVKISESDAFLNEWRNGYRTRFPDRISEFFA
jgi:galactokinase